MPDPREPERYFYHTFPRPRVDLDSIAHGIKILESIADNGLILTPEMQEFRESLRDGTLGNPIQLFQKRICFTELAPSEVADHSRTFGPISIEWDIATLRSMGAIPVFYVPLRPAPDSLEGIGVALLARLGEIQTVLTRLESLSAAVRVAKDPQEALSVTRNGVVAGTTRMTAGGAADLINFLQYEHQPIDALTASIRALCGYFYPVDDAAYTGPLGYYRQREWRIVANMTHLGRDVTAPLNHDVQAKIAEMNPAFWNKTMQFPSGVHTRVQQSQIMPSLRDIPIIRSARRIVAPAHAEALVAQVLRARRLDLPLVTLESL